MVNCIHFLVSSLSVKSKLLSERSWLLPIVGFFLNLTDSEVIRSTASKLIFRRRIADSPQITSKLYLEEEENNLIMQILRSLSSSLERSDFIHSIVMQIVFACCSPDKHSLDF